MVNDPPTSEAAPRPWHVAPLAGSHKVFYGIFDDGPEGGLIANCGAESSRNWANAQLIVNAVNERGQSAAVGKAMARFQWCMELRKERDALEARLVGALKALKRLLDAVHHGELDGEETGDAEDIVSDIDSAELLERSK